MVAPRRTTRSGRTTSRKSRQRNALSPRLGGKSRKWCRVKRPPGPAVPFAVWTWVPLESLTEKERAEYAPLEEEEKTSSPTKVDTTTPTVPTGKYPPCPPPTQQQLLHANNNNNNNVSATPLAAPVATAPVDPLPASEIMIKDALATTTTTPATLSLMQQTQQRQQKPVPTAQQQQSVANETPVSSSSTLPATNDNNNDNAMIGQPETKRQKLDN